MINKELIFYNLLADVINNFAQFSKFALSL